MESYFSKYGGSVISTTFDKYCYVNVRHLPPFFGYRNEIIYSKTERVSMVSEIVHPAVRNAMQYLDMHEIRLTYEADLPARSGLGTSSSFAVGMLNAFYALKGKYADKKKLADEAIYLERVLCNESGGWQDQIAVAYGGFNRIDFNCNGYTVRPVIISPQRKKQLNDSLMMFFTGFTRYSFQIHGDKSNDNKENQIKILQKMQSLVSEAESILQDNKSNLDDFGRLLDYTWTLKKKSSGNVSNDSIDLMYESAKRAGALGGKLLGAGGGGFLVFYVNPENRINVKNALSNLLYIPFNFEDTGSRVIYYSPEIYENRYGEY